MTVREGVVCEIKERNYKEGIQRNRQDFFHSASFILLGSAPSWGVHNRWAHKHEKRRLAAANAALVRRSRIVLSVGLV